MSKEAVDRLRERAQNEQTVFALSDLCRAHEHTIETLTKQKNLLLTAAIMSKKTIDILWVSHHANRCDAALEALEEAIKVAENP